MDIAWYTRITLKLLRHSQITVLNIFLPCFEVFLKQNLSYIEGITLLIFWIEDSNSHKFGHITRYFRHIPVMINAIDSTLIHICYLYEVISVCTVSFIENDLYEHTQILGHNNSACCLSQRQKPTVTYLVSFASSVALSYRANFNLPVLRYLPYVEYCFQYDIVWTRKSFL